MNIVLIEDEEQAARRLSRMVREILPQDFLHGPLESISQAISWFQSNPEPDLVLLDIHLADGLSFAIFDAVAVSAPIIFTTAYDQYAIRAFKLNSIDYLLKPIETDQLKAALGKWQDRKLSKAPVLLGNDWHRELNNDMNRKFKQRFLSRVGDKLQAVETKDVLYVFSENKGTYLHTESHKNLLIDLPLEQVEPILDPAIFFRINRQYMIRFEAIEKMLAYSNSRLKVSLRGCDDADIVLSREKTREFKEWLDG